MTVIQALIELQEVDGRIRELEMELKDLPRRKALESARLSGVSADLLAAKANQEYAVQRVRGYEEEAKSFKEKVDQLKRDQINLKTNKEYQQYSIQIDLVNHDFEAAENNQMAAMDILPQAEAAAPVAEEAPVVTEKPKAVRKPRAKKVKAEEAVAPAETVEEPKKRTRKTKAE